MRIDPFAGHPYRKRAWGEGLLLGASAPFLLFPTVFVPGTLVVGLLLAVMWVWPLPASGRRQWLRPTPLNGALLLFCLALVLSILVTADPDFALPKATGLLLGLTVWRYLTWAAQTDRALVAATWGFVLAGLGFTLIGVVSANWTVKVPFLAALLPQRLLSLPEGDSAGVQTNKLAGTILFYFPLLASLLLGLWGRQAWRNWRTWGVLAGTAVMGGLLVLTQSRSGWLGGLGGMLVLLALWGLAAAPGRQRFWLRLALLVALVALFAGLAVIGPTRLAALWQDPDLETAV
ncbi:MAG: hypothetical protein KC413_05065, partial [Anaerolineales bacterium]|nr:hypothetical protein [Anaerolineales bacterium]